MGAASAGVWLRRAGQAAASRVQGGSRARCGWRGLADGRRSEESQFARDLEGTQLRVRAWAAPSPRAPLSERALSLIHARAGGGHAGERCCGRAGPDHSGLVPSEQKLRSVMQQEGGQGRPPARSPESRAALAPRPPARSPESRAADETADLARQPSLQETMAWVQAKLKPPPSQARVYRDLAEARSRALVESADQAAAADQAASFEVVQDGDGAVRVVPKKKAAPAVADKGATEAALLAILAEKPGMTERELRHLFPRLFPPRADAPGDMMTANTFHDTPYWWWPGKWITYGKTLSHIANNRFVLFKEGKVDGAELYQLPHHPDPRERADALPPPNAAWEAKMEEERVKAVGQLLEQRAALRAQVRDIESDLRKLGMDVEEDVGGQSVLDMRRAEGRQIAMRALAIATVLVLLAAGVAAYVFHLYTGVRTVREFRDWWRAKIRGQDYHAVAAPYSRRLEALTPRVEGSALSDLAHNISTSLAYSTEPASQLAHRGVHRADGQPQAGAQQDASRERKSASG